MGLADPSDPDAASAATDPTGPSLTDASTLDGLQPRGNDSSEGFETGRLRAAIGSRLFRKPADPRGTTIGRYTIVALLGEGGMGVVYEAHDPALDRRVALKVLKGDDDDPHAGARLAREARALARLSDPHVVGVFEVGRWHGRHFVAMEFIDGVDLSTYVRDLRHSRVRPARIVATMRDCARGLAAAHAAGLVHRDFKPANVLVSRDGRVRVADFGLAIVETGFTAGVNTGVPAAIAAERGGPGNPTAAATAATAPSHDEPKRLTRHGAIVGTPLYMAPEQLGGLPADARSDQFSFCLTWLEIASGNRPLPGLNAAARYLAFERGELQERVADLDAPRWLKRLLSRGLAFDPALRYRTMNDLVARIRVRSRRPTMAAVGLLVTAAAGAWWLGGGPSEPRCVPPPVFGDEWNADAQRATKNRFVDSQLQFAPAAWEQVQRGLDERAAQWSAAYREICRSGNRDPAALDAAMACLSQRREELVQYARLLPEADASLIERAATSVSKLGDASECQARTDDATSSDPGVVEARTWIARAHASQAAGKYRESAAQLGKAAARLDDAPDPWTRAELEVLRGDTQWRLGEYNQAHKTFETAFWNARECGHDRAAVRAATWLVYIAGYSENDPEQALVWSRHAQALIRRLESAEREEATLATNLAAIEVRHGDRERGTEQALAAAAQWDALGDDVQVAKAYMSVGAGYRGLGRLDEAADYFRQSLEIQRRVYGPSHPALVGAFINVANVDSDRGQFEDALEQYRLALTLLHSADGSAHPRAALLHTLMGNAFAELGRHTEAGRHLVQAVEIKQAALGPNHPDLTAPLQNLGSHYLETERPSEALVQYSRVAEILRGRYGPLHPRVCDAQILIAEAELMLDNAQAVLTTLTECRETLGAEVSPALADELDSTRAAALLSLNRPKESAALLEATIARGTTEGSRLGVLQIRLGEALWAQGEREAARAQYRLAVATTDAAGPGALYVRTTAQAWLSKHGP